MEFKYILILIVIVYLPVLITGQYTLRGVPESYAVLGENYTLQCDVTDSAQGVNFGRNNIVVCSMINCESSSIDNRYKCGCINNNNKQLYLNISNINKQDDTTWSCRGNSGGQGSSTVPVYYPPYITSIISDAVNNEIDEGSDVIFNCNVDSKPVSTITWSSSTISDTYTGQRWTLTQAKCQDTGIYTCTANNGIGQSTTKLPLNIRSNNSIGQSSTKSLPLNIRCSPRINGDLKDEVMNRLGEEVTLLIDVIAYPKPSFKWIQESTGLVLTQDTIQQVATDNYISSLTFTIQQSSFGNYSVTVNNSIGDDKSYTIKIIDGDPGTKPISVEETLYKECLGTGIGIGIGISVMCLLLVLLTIFIYRKYHPANKKLPEESYATFSNRIPEDRTYEDLNTRSEVNDNNQHNSEDVKEYENMRGN
ncbi:hypothetical protein LOTGIDRAFT_175247 [Lottia gigantea]|uniref:Ig-like domain-containing protein n=1 Tax=Lottia gigantea TaxID=225164 RepID=V4C147_LOTGI|nr:hypothetical protein LOTGIDRAFT_175247 [Lottia gigantea]ESO95194.1 hypothetical protein LOTGIDRAFT_175247 [Lottia gigantea]